MLYIIIPYHIYNTCRILYIVAHAYNILYIVAKIEIFCIGRNA